jgi:hypothetical protein
MRTIVSQKGLKEGFSMQTLASTILDLWARILFLFSVNILNLLSNDWVIISFFSEVIFEGIPVEGSVDMVITRQDGKCGQQVRP